MYLLDLFIATAVEQACFLAFELFGPFSSVFYSFFYFRQNHFPVMPSVELFSDSPNVLSLI